MRRGPSIGVRAAALVALSGCAGTTGAVLRVRPPPPAADDGAAAQQLRVEEAVRDVAAMAKLSCRPPPDPGRGVLDCWPADAATRALVSLHLQAAPGGYEVTILESSGGFSGPRLLCSIQDRLAERLELRLAGGVVQRDPRVSCQRKSGP